MGDSDKAAIASFVMRGKEYLAAVRADGDLLALETLREARRPARDSEAKGRPGRVSQEGTVQEACREGAG
jgi:DNA end-binding protein Ku